MLKKVKSYELLRSSVKKLEKYLNRSSLTPLMCNVTPLMCNEIQNPPKRKGIIDINQLMELLNVGDLHSLQQLHQQLVEEELLRDYLQSKIDQHG